MCGMRAERRALFLGFKSYGYFANPNHHAHAHAHAYAHARPRAQERRSNASTTSCNTYVRVPLTLAEVCESTLVSFAFLTLSHIETFVYFLL